MQAILAAVAGAVVLVAAPAIAQLEGITNRDAVAAFRAALEKGSQAAVAALGREDGFLGNAKVRIPLPESLERAEKVMRRVGAGKYADELIVTMNRAAEAAVPEAKTLLLDSIKKMSVQDAKGILTGGETSATDYFRRTTRDQLHARFLPVVHKATVKVKLAEKYEQYADKAASAGLIGKDAADLDGYVTGKALEGLYLTIGEEEKKIRRDPIGTGSAIIKKVFGRML